MVPVTTVQLAVGHRVETTLGRGKLVQKFPAEGGGYHLTVQLDKGGVLNGTTRGNHVWQVELNS